MAGAPRNNRGLHLGVPLLLMVALVASACSGSFEVSFGGQSAPEAAVDLIEGEAMGQRLQLGAITDAACEEPPEVDVGVVFDCTAQSAGETLDFEVEVEPEGRIFASVKNVIVGSDVPAYAKAAVEALNSQNDFGLAADSIDCGTESVVLNAADEMACALVDPGTGEEFIATLTVSNTALGTFDVEITDVAE